MKENRMKFDKLRMGWDIKKMSAAYIRAEQILVDKEAETTQIKFEFDPMTPEQFHTFEVDGFGNIRHYSQEEELIKKGLEVQDKINKALESEDYRKVIMFKNIFSGLEIQYKNLKRKQ